MVKNVNDYLEEIQEKFPSLSQSEIRKIVTFGFRMYTYVNKRGADVLIKSDGGTKITAMTGYLTNDSLKHYTRGLFKWRMKERIMYGLKNKKWDGYYYFGMTDENHHLLTDQLNRKAKRIVNLDHVFCYKVLDEIYHDHSVDYIYKLKYPDEVGYKIYFKKFKEKKVDIEYVDINKESTWHRKQQIVLQKD